MPAADPPPLTWRQLPPDVRVDLQQKLIGLYGRGADAEAFDALELDKQQSLLIFVRRLNHLQLWSVVRRVENVYGTGGVGMNFISWPSISAALSGRRDFTKLFAKHRGSLKGFRERRRESAALHFLCEDDRREYRWSVHFDLHNPLSSPSSAWRHLTQEKLRAMSPGWRTIRDKLSASQRSAHAVQSFTPAFR
ncbi:MAG TPA: hypothetical protein VM866_04845 [Pyrinomonadaceae bacterium]|jgi:hypothetical protein|nr:hypothetical protein [Pyrinomonadaceae bacterium]